MQWSWYKIKYLFIFFNRVFLVPKPNNNWRAILDLSKLNLFLKAEKFKMETPETIRTSLQQGEWVTSTDFRDAYFHIPIQYTVQEISEISCKGSDIPVQGSSIRFVHSTHGVHCYSKRGKTDDHTQGYKNPPVPRRLVGESQIPSGLSPAYTGSSENSVNSSVIHKQGRRHEARPTLCPTIENLDLVYQETRDSKLDTFQAS